MRILSLSPAGDEILAALGVQQTRAEAQPDVVIVDADHDTLEAPARMVVLNATSIETTLQSILQMGEVTGATREAASLVQSLRGRLDRVREAMKGVMHRPTVAALTHLVPPHACGLWVPEQIEIAGGRSMLGEAGQPAQQIDWDDVIGAQPEMVIVMPRDNDIAGSVQAFIDVADHEVWRDLPATYLWQLYAVDAAYFSRPGPRIVDGVEILAGMIHPHLWPAPGPEHALRVNDVLQTQMRVDRNRRLRLD
jgi:iron complex transport system substrate-binding protein